MVISIIQLCCEIYFLQIGFQFQLLSCINVKNDTKIIKRCSVKCGAKNALNVTCILYPNSIDILLFEINNR